MSETQPIALDRMSLGQHATVKALNDALPISQRLMSMGLMPGIEVKLVHVAPLGDPIAIEFHGRCLSLRRTEASLIQVLPLNA